MPLDARGAEQLGGGDCSTKAIDEKIRSVRVQVVSITFTIDELA